MDLYIVDRRIAIECDEHNHKYRDVKYEKTREEKIKTALNCTFIRFNPDDENFAISTLTSIIVKQCLTNQ